ncbi:MAG: MFS transporter [Anaerolineae bacterium]|nr:MFS transporter [Anaerolineae bacterium]
MRRLRAIDYITVNIYWLGLNFVTGGLTPIILPYLVQQFVPEVLKNTYYGGLRTAGLIVAILVQPLAGMLSDRSTLRWGRRRPFIFLGTMLDLVFLAWIARSGNYWMLFVAVLFLQFSSNIAHGALQGLIPDLVPREQRGRASGVKAVMELLPVILLPLLGIGLLVDQGRVWAAVLVIMVALFIAMILTMMVREEPLRERPEMLIKPRVARIVLLTLIFVVATSVFGGLVGFVGALLKESGVLQLVAVGLAGLVAMAGAIVVGVWLSARVGIGEGAHRHSSFVWWVINRLLFFAAVTSIQGFAQYFLQDVLEVSNPGQATAVLMAVVGVFTVIAALGSGFLADRFGRKRLLILTGIVAGAGTLLLLFSVNIFMVYFSGFLIGVATGVFVTTNWALGTDLVPPEEAGRYLGISNLAGAGAGVVGAGIGGPLADFFNMSSPGLGYLVVFAIYGVCFLLSSVTLLKVREPREAAFSVAG